MNLYSSKQRWKIVLFLIAIGIVVASLWYSSVIVNQVRLEEREKVGVWSVAIKKKANMVYLINDLFKQLKEEELLKAKLWASAINFMNSASKDPNADIDFGLPLSVIESIDSIPIILTDDRNKFHSATGFPDSIDKKIASLETAIFRAEGAIEKARKESEMEAYLRPILIKMDSTNEPLPLHDGYGATTYLHFDESTKLQTLQFRHDTISTSFTKELVNNSLSVPVLFSNYTMDSVIATNINGITSGPANKLALKRMKLMAAAQDTFGVELGLGEKGLIFYEDSDVLVRLKYYPYIQFGIIGLFLVISYILFSSFRKAEQNQVWVGMAKETAHQLGTPLSSLMAWVDLLEAKGVDQETLSELNKDVERLEIITDRFSKIGSETELTEQFVSQPVEEIVDYLSKRVSRHMVLEVIKNSDPKVPLNKPLFEWVIENICKNAIDAMKGEGSITVTISESAREVYIDLQDTGSGIAAGKFKQVFQPGYTTKKRGWGLGLSLVKRIVEEYHNGKIFVKHSEVGVGTTFRIVLNKKR